MAGLAVGTDAKVSRGKVVALLELYVILVGGAVNK